MPPACLPAPLADGEFIGFCTAHAVIFGLGASAEVSTSPRTSLQHNPHPLVCTHNSSQQIRAGETLDTTTSPTIRAQALWTGRTTGRARRTWMPWLPATTLCSSTGSTPAAVFAGTSFLKPALVQPKQTAMRCEIRRDHSSTVHHMFTISSRNLCFRRSPTRSSVLTGRTSDRECIFSAEGCGTEPAWTCVDPYPLPPTTFTAAELAKANGYATIHIGKVGVTMLFITQSLPLRSPVVVLLLQPQSSPNQSSGTSAISFQRATNTPATRTRNGL